jgi:hypothetical protein
MPDFALLQFPSVGQWPRQVFLRMRALTNSRPSEA